MSRKKNQARLRQRKTATKFEEIRAKFADFPEFAELFETLPRHEQFQVAELLGSIPGKIVGFGSSDDACCPQPEAQGAEADRRSEGDLGRESAAVGNTIPREAQGCFAPAPASSTGIQSAPCMIPVQDAGGEWGLYQEVRDWEVNPFNPEEHRVPKHPPCHQIPVAGCDCIDCTQRPRLNIGWRRR